MLIEPDLTFSEFMAAGSAFRMVSLDAESPVRSIESRVTEWFQPYRAGGVTSKALLCIERLVAADQNGPRLRCRVVSAELNLTSHALWELLERAFHANFIQCRRAVMMRRILPMIADTPEQFAQIAFGVGYKDAGHLSRDCRKFLGVTPKAFRQIASTLAAQ